MISKIHFIRGQKIMVDMDLAELYGVEKHIMLNPKVEPMRKIGFKRKGEG